MPTTADERITDRKRVTGLLKRIMDQHSLLTITLANSADAYNSAILDLDEGHQSLTLDELKPVNGHARLLDEGHLHARAALHGIEIQFGARLREAVKESGIWMYRFELPSELLYRQRRANYRIRVGMGSDVSVELHKDGHELVEARVLNMSETGLGIRIQSPIPLNLGDCLPCTLGLPNDQRIHCQLEIRYLRKTPQADGSVHFGGHFVNLDGPQRAALSRIIIDLQRDMIRRLPKD